MIKTPSPELLDLTQKARAASEIAGGEQAWLAWSRVQTLDPTNAEAAFQLGSTALSMGDHDRAERSLRQAIQLDSKSALAHALLARVHSKRGELEQAMAALTTAIAIDPLAWGAYFEKAGILQELGRHREAALTWTIGLQVMPQHARELPQLAQLIAHAQDRVVKTRAELGAYLANSVADLIAATSGEEKKRVEHCLGILSGQRQAVVSRPSMLAYPRLPAIAFFEPEDYEWAAPVEAAFHDILDELHAVLADDASGFEPYVQIAEGEIAGQFSQLDGNLDWGAYFLWKHGQRIDAHCARCPKTEQALAYAPQVVVPQRAPVALFSALKPGTHIPPHNGATNTRLTVHLPLIVPEGCAIRVGDEVRQWKPGHLLAFDDTIEHEAWNPSSSLRVVLIFDVWHPMLTLLERELISKTVEGIMAFYGQGADLGEL